MSNHICLVVMIKYPEPGNVKTRLGRQIGMVRAARLYNDFVLAMIARCREMSFPVIFSCHPDRSEEDYRKWLGTDNPIIFQNGTNLGAIMQDCFEQLFLMGFVRVVMTGSDIPHLPVKYIERGCKALDDNDIVMGPAMDGGYYLLGMKKSCFLSRIFNGIPWSTSQVYPMTMQIIKENRLKCYVLPALRDVDTLDDLEELNLVCPLPGQ